MSRGKHLRISLQELKIGKIGRKERFQPCSEQFDNYLTALQDLGDYARVPSVIVKALEDCMGEYKGRPKTPSFAINYHIAQYVDRKK